MARELLLPRFADEVFSVGDIGEIKFDPFQCIEDPAKCTSMVG